MNDTQWQSVMTSLSSFFPAMAERLTDAQARAWRKVLDGFDPQLVQEVLGRWYANENEWPVLAKIAAACRPDLVKQRTGRESWKKVTGDVWRAECRKGLELLEARRRRQEPKENA